MIEKRLADHTQDEIGAWGDTTFPESTMQTITAHLLREATALYIAAHAADFALDWSIAQDDIHGQTITELEKASYRLDEGGLAALNNPARLAEECADVALLLYHAAHRGRFSLYDATMAKFVTIKTWAWGAPDAAGVVEHERAEE